MQSLTRYSSECMADSAARNYQNSVFILCKHSQKKKSTEYRTSKVVFAYFIMMITDLCNIVMFFLSFHLNYGSHSKLLRDWLTLLEPRISKVRCPKPYSQCQLLNLFLYIFRNVNINIGNHFYSSVMHKFYLAKVKINMRCNIVLAALFLLFWF